MIEHLRLRNVGPAPGMDMELAPRLNLITGDNGLGKSFLLDVIWWALTRKWPQEVNPHMNAGYAARPATPGEDATIGFRARGRSTDAEYEARYVPRDQAWVGSAGRPLLPGLVIYAHTDGSFSYWDPARNYWRRRGDVDVSERRPAQVFTQDEVWNGAHVQENGRHVPICNGLINDWANWVGARNDSHETMAAVLKRLAPAGTGVRIEPGKPTRISIDDPRIFRRFAPAMPKRFPFCTRPPASAALSRWHTCSRWRGANTGWPPHSSAKSRATPSCCLSMRRRATCTPAGNDPSCARWKAPCKNWISPRRFRWSSRHIRRWCWPPQRRGSTKNATPGSTWTWRTIRMSFSVVGRMNAGERSATGSRARRSTCSPTAEAWRRSRLSCELGELLSGEDPSLDEVEEVGRELGKVLSDSDPFLAGWATSGELLRE